MLPNGMEGLTQDKSAFLEGHIWKDLKDVNNK
jgi:hypothetical protein